MRGTLRLAVDERDLNRDWRGIARYVRAILTRFARRDDVAVTLVRRGLFGLRAPRTADVVWHPWNGTFFSSAAPAVVTLHALVPFRFPDPDGRKREGQQAPFRRSAAEGRRFLADSAFTANDAHEILGIARERIEVVPLGVEAPFTASGPAFALPDGRAYVLHAGAHDPHKNTSTLIAGWQRAFPDARVALAFTRTPAVLPAGAVVLDGLSDVALAEVYRGALAVAVPSLCEGFGLPLLEAMACGAPAIAARSSSLPEVGGDACEWVERPLDVDEWSANLALLATSESRRAGLRATGLERAAWFTWERCAQATFAVLDAAARDA